MAKNRNSVRRAWQWAGIVPWLLAAFVHTLAHSDARAEEKLAGGFVPAIDIRESSASVLSPVATSFNQLDVAAALSYGRHPLLVGLPGGLRAPIVNDAFTTHALASYGVWEDLDVGVDLPFHLMTAGAPGAPGRLNSNVGALGDIRVEPRYRIWGLESRLFDVGAALGVALPTGDQARYAGAGLRGHARALAVLRPFEGLQVIGNAGVLDGADAMGSFTWGAAGLFELGSPRLEALGELDGRLGFEGQRISSLDARVGVRWALGAWRLQGGPEMAIIVATGHPAFGAWVAVGRDITLPKRAHFASDDADRDGFANATDPCRYMAEDRDGFQDDDGCPDLDNDDDGIVDRFDEAPSSAEDRDGVDDADGAPETALASASQASDSDGDDDGVVDSADRCPEQPGSIAAIGCLDSDADAVSDADDKCPSVLGLVDNHGCPAETKAVLAADTIDITTTIVFLLDDANLSADAKPTLDQIAELMIANPNVRRLRVEGHADLKGDTARNRGLSQARADAVMRALVERGVERARLEAVGFGSQNPLVNPEVTAADGAKNRRVELHIVHTDEEKP